MAFDPSKSAKNNIEKALSSTAKTTNNNNTNDVIESQSSEELSINIPTSAYESEKTKVFNFSLQPSVRKKADILAKKYGYRSASRFINELLKNIETGE